MSLDRAVLAFAGFMVLLSVVLDRLGLAAASSGSPSSSA